MASIVVIYGTSEGQTAKIAERIAGTLTERGHDVVARDVTHLPPSFSLAGDDAVLLGGSIHAGKQAPAVVQFAGDHRDALAASPSGFFQVCLAAAESDEESQAEAAGYVDDFRAATGWEPDRVAVFAGALRYSEYGFLKRLLMKAIAGRTTGDTDTSRDYEYTDWGAVEAFAAEFAADVEAAADADEGPDSQVDPDAEPDAAADEPAQPRR